jgi:hypothetical protein
LNTWNEAKRKAHGVEDGDDFVLSPDFSNSKVNEAPRSINRATAVWILEFLAPDTIILHHDDSTNKDRRYQQNTESAS